MNATRSQRPAGPWTADQDEGSDPKNKEVGRDKKPEDDKKEE